MNKLTNLFAKIKDIDFISTLKYFIFGLSILIIIYIIFTNQVLSINNDKLQHEVNQLDSISVVMEQDILLLNNSKQVFKTRIDSINLNVEVLYQLKKKKDKTFEAEYNQLRVSLINTIDSINKVYPVIQIVEE